MGEKYLIYGTCTLYVYLLFGIANTLACVLRASLSSGDPGQLQRGPLREGLWHQRRPEDGDGHGPNLTPAPVAVRGQSQCEWATH